MVMVVVIVMIMVMVMVKVMVISKNATMTRIMHAAGNVVTPGIHLFMEGGNNLLFLISLCEAWTQVVTSPPPWVVAARSVRITCKKGLHRGIVDCIRMCPLYPL